MSVEARRASTIEDVAARAGVSRAAVSKVIRDAYGVSPAMRAKVQSAIDELGYRPRVSARGMRGSTYTLGFEIPSVSNHFFPKIITGATGALAGSPDARANFDAFPRSARHAILGWIATAKRPETRAKRIAETARLAQDNVRANQPRP